MGNVKIYDWDKNRAAIEALLLERFVSKRTGEICTIIGVSKYGVCLGLRWFNYDDFMNKWMFYDGSPCGIEEGGEE